MSKKAMILRVDTRAVGDVKAELEIQYQSNISRDETFVLNCITRQSHVCM